LASEAARDVKASKISRRAAAIRYAHTARDLPDPATSEQVRRAMRGIRRSIGAAPAQKAPAVEIVAAMLAHCLADAGRPPRSRCWRSELAALDVEDHIEESDGFRVRIRRSKPTRKGRGRRSPPCTADTCCPGAR
jgi:integrase